MFRHRVVHDFQGVLNYIVKTDWFKDTRFVGIFVLQADDVFDVFVLVADFGNLGQEKASLLMHDLRQ